MATNEKQVENKQLERLREQKNKLTSRASSSKTLRGNQSPSPSDIALQSSLRENKQKIDEIKSNRLQRRWYGEAEEEPIEKGQPGIFGKTVDILSRPVYGMVGATDFALGNSPEDSLADAVTHNMTESKRLAGDILRDAGVPGIISAPAGFMLDVAFDPVSWATLGTSALVPRTAAGLAVGTKRGGLAAGAKAAGRGAESRFLEGYLRARDLKNTVSGKSRKLAKNAGKETKDTLMGRLGGKIEKRAAYTASEFDDLMGRDFLGSLPNRGTPAYFVSDDSRYKQKFGDLVREAGENTPFVKNFFKHFDYNNAEWMRVARIKDILKRKLGTEDQFAAGISAYIRSVDEGMSFDEALKKVQQETGKVVSERVATSRPVKQQLDFGDNFVSASSNSEVQRSLASLPELGDVMDDVSGSQGVIQNPEKYVSMDQIENARRLAQEQGLSKNADTFMQDIKDMIDREDLGSTGVQWYDDLRRRAKNFKKEVGLSGKKDKIIEKTGKTLDTYEALIQVFKRGAVGASPSAWMNAVIGNPVMYGLAGGNVLDPLWLDSIKRAHSIKRKTLPHFSKKEDK